MNAIITHLRGAIVSTLVFSVVLCGFYPVAVWGIGQVAFKDKADGSLIVDKEGKIRGSRLLGQNFTGEGYFHPRPSSAGANGYDAASSSGSNLGPTSQKLADQIKERVIAYRELNELAEDQEVPADAVTASGSGLDPHISPGNAALQVSRVARSRGIQEEAVRELIHVHTARPDLGFLRDPGVNVVELNMALDSLK